MGFEESRLSKEECMGKERNSSWALEWEERATIRGVEAQYALVQIRHDKKREESDVSISKERDNVDKKRKRHTKTHKSREPVKVIAKKARKKSSHHMSN